MLKIGEALHRLRTGLERIYDAGEALAIAELVLEDITGLGRLERLMRKGDVMGADEESRFLQIERRLLAGEPLQYVQGKVLFLGRSFAVTPAVLIPRPETEELVQWVAAENGQSKAILDIGTGSGCIAISLKLALPQVSVSAIDLSVDALSVARQNAGVLDADVRFSTSDFLDADARAALGRFDVIVSNPPYIPISEAATLHPNVREHEPAMALFVPADDALVFYRAIAIFGRTHLKPGGRIYCELHRDHALDTQELFLRCGYTDTVLRNDMFGEPRMLRAMA